LPVDGPSGRATRSAHLAHIYRRLGTTDPSQVSWLVAVFGYVVLRRDVRFVLATGLALGLCVAVTAPAPTSAATNDTGGTASAGKSSTGGTPQTTTRASAGQASSTTASAPSTIDAGPTRPTWREAEIVLTVDPSYMAMPYAKQALEGALLAWTSVADQLPKVTLRYAEDLITSQSADKNLADHRIFYAPSGDRRAKGALAITLVTADENNNSIMDADILVNGGHLFTDVAAADYKKSATMVYDLQNVLTHELGHWFGLDEDTTNGEATMYAYVFPGETKKRDLAESDINAVQLAYWQADNPSENHGCSLGRTPTNRTPWTIGCLTAALYLLQRRKRRSQAHVLGRACRLQP
jgi:hypothetical protein